jgi:lipopolysaccharide/colanic/teichoic acid biosynthesis glycosyltransferase
MLQHPLTSVIEGGHQFYSLQQEPLEDPFNRILKRLLDIVIALPIVLFVLPPLSVWVWLMQRLQAPGRLFFVRNRTGHGQREFAMLKFRSMYDAAKDPKIEVQQARRGDDRTYPFGRFIRKTSLDEFPQFINVLKGDMSVVGPRPHLVAHDVDFNSQMKGYRTRFFVKPGITGLAQCNGFRGEITDHELLVRRIRLDVTYVAEWSIWLDLVIIGKTARQVLFPPKTAY